MCTVMDLPTSILACLFAALMFTGFHNQFPLLTMICDALIFERALRSLSGPLGNQCPFLMQIKDRARNHKGLIVYYVPGGAVVFKKVSCFKTDPPPPPKKVYPVRNSY